MVGGSWQVGVGREELHCRRPAEGASTTGWGMGLAEMRGQAQNSEIESLAGGGDGDACFGEASPKLVEEPGPCGLVAVDEDDGSRREGDGVVGELFAGGVPAEVEALDLAVDLAFVQGMGR